jgi:hypothetical protein
MTRSGLHSLDYFLNELDLTFPIITLFFPSFSEATICLTIFCFLIAHH